MMNIDIYVQDPVMVFEQLKYSQHNIIHKTKPASLLFFRVMQASHPVNCNISTAVIQLDCSVQTRPCRYLEEVVHSLEAGAVALTYFEVRHRLVFGGLDCILFEL